MSAVSISARISASERCRLVRDCGIMLRRINRLARFVGKAFDVGVIGR
jgi:hypothetical protein